MLNARGEAGFVGLDSWRKGRPGPGHGQARARQRLGGVSRGCGTRSCRASCGLGRHEGPAKVQRVIRHAGQSGRTQWQSVPGVVGKAAARRFVMGAWEVTDRCRAGARGGRRRLLAGILRPGSVVTQLKSAPAPVSSWGHPPRGAPATHAAGRPQRGPDSGRFTASSSRHSSCWRGRACRGSSASAWANSASASMLRAWASSAQPRSARAAA